MFKGLDVTQSYDWDESDAEKPMHNLSMLDRLVSWFPDKPARALHDDFFLKYGRAARQRVIAMALTRGPTAVGFNWIPQPTGEQARPEICADMKFLWSWGASLQRRVCTDETAGADRYSLQQSAGDFATNHRR